MNPQFYEINPFRRPQWRSDRVMQMVAHCPKPSRPRSFDDHYVRAYRNFLMGYLSAGKDEELRQAAIADRPHVYHAHMLYFAPDSQLRQIVEARLLTTESVSEIATRMSTEEKAIEFFEKLFFNVRDRLDARDWIIKVIFGPPEDCAVNKDGVMTEGQRGFLYRLFGHYGGPLALDALIGGMAPTAMPRRPEDVGAWVDETLGNMIRLRANEAAQSLNVNKHNVMRLLRLAVTAQRADRSTAWTSPGVSEESAQKILQTLNRDYYKQMFATSKTQFQTGACAAPSWPIETCPSSVGIVKRATVETACRDGVAKKVPAQKTSQADVSTDQEIPCDMTGIGMQEGTEPVLVCDGSA